MRKPFLLLPALWLAAAAQTPPAFRLPENAAPVRYAVDLKLAPPDDGFSGTEEIAVTLKAPARVIWMHASGLETDSVEVQAAGQKVGARAVPAKDFLGIALDRPAGPGEVTVRLAWHGKLSSTSSDGLFLNKDEGRQYIFSQFEPVSARRAFPCFDEPRFKTPWQLTLHVPKGNLAFSNTPQAGETVEADGTVTYRFAETKPLPSYLVALAVGPFDVVDAGTAGVNRIPVRIVVPQGRAAEAAYAAKVSARILDLLESYFGIPYPYEKLDNVDIPMAYGFGAMENAGLITYARSLITAKPSEQSLRFEREYVAVAAHEMAHQWFGDLVTMEWWDDTWLNEAFATWMEQKTMAQWDPKANQAVSDAADMEGAMRADSLVSARQVRQPVATADDIANAFDTITYQKGAAVIRMFENWVGTEAFRRGVQVYLKRHAFGNGTASQFLRDVGEGSGKDIQAAFLTFLEQPGVPLVTAALRCGAGAPVLQLSQKRYLPLGSPGSGGETWRIPVCLRYGAGGRVEQQCTMLDTPAAEVKLGLGACPEWLEANAEEKGYYHVEYPGGRLGKLAADRGRLLTEPERAGVLADSRALMRGGEVPASHALEMARTFAGDPQREVVASGIGIVEGVETYVPPSLTGKYNAFVRSGFGTRAAGLGWKPKPGESENDRLLRPVLVGFVARNGDDKKLVAEARKLAEHWLSDRTAVNREVLAAVLETAAQYGDAALFDRFLAAARAERNQRDRSRLLAALGQFRKPELAERALALTLSPDFDPRETVRLLLGAADYPELAALPFDFVRRHFDELVKRLPRGIGSDAGAMLPQTAHGMCTLDARDQVAAFFQPRVAAFTGAPRILAQVLEEIQVCAAVKAKQGPDVAEFLQRQR